MHCWEDSPMKNAKNISSDLSHQDREGDKEAEEFNRRENNDRSPPVHVWKVENVRIFREQSLTGTYVGASDLEIRMLIKVPSTWPPYL